jgi:uncharacterized protein YrzB (UPF0473 family)
MDDQLPNIIELIDENNETVAFEHIMTLDYDGREYVVLAPAGEGTDSAEEDEIVILRVEQDENGDDFYSSIDDEDELEEVFSAVTEIYEKSLQ